jgi:hypothetical protein
VTRHGFTAMMSNQKPILHNGSQKCHPDPKGTASSVKYDGDVNFFFFYCEVLFTMNFHFVARRSRKSTILKWWNICKREWEANGPICGGRKDACSFITMLLHIPHCLFVSLKKFGNFANSPHVCRLNEKWCLHFNYLWLNRNILINET